jgi:DNA polymerase V
MSARVMRVLSGFTPNLEIYSIDEAFLGLPGFELRLETHARECDRRFCNGRESLFLSE